jgi:transcriptional regulator of nitric oxide reductase/ferredoxin
MSPTSANARPGPGRGTASPGRRVVGWAGLIAAFLAVAGTAAAEPPPTAGELAQAFPGAGRVEAFSGQPPAAPVYRGGQLAGYVFSTFATIGSVGYSGRPIDILAGIDTRGVVTGAYLRRHNEPILVIGIPEDRLKRYVTGFAGLDVKNPVREGTAGVPDIISGASVSSAVIREAVVRSARAVARSRGLVASGDSGARLDRETFAEATWQDLMADGSIVRLRLNREAVDAALDPSRADKGDGAETPFVDLYAGLITPPRVGQNLLGQRDYNSLLGGLGLKDQAIVVAANGLYSFKGTDWVRSGRFDRIELVQGNRTIQLVKSNHRTVETLKVSGAPEFREIGVFVVTADTGFDGLAPWRLGLLVTRETAGGNAVHAGFDLSYSLPARYRIGGEAEARTAVADPPLWQRLWRQKIGATLALTAMLAVLTAILIFQDVLVQSYRRFRMVRLTFLAVTLVWLGWYAGEQLSVVNVLTFVHSLMTEFHWEFFLLDPLAFVLWSYVAVTLLFWGRGVFCGWLCPFGALQELMNEAARKLKVPQIRVPFLLHERLWPIKYILFLGLFALSLHSTNMAVMASEIEPFKTVISMKFMRAWPFVLYAAALLAAGLFVERFFCRYLCPLGGALAIPARLRMFDWLKRRPQCGEVCGICADRCTVQAIHPTGAINPNECIHCLHCQTLYFDPNTCPPLIAQRKRRERRAALAGTIPRFGEPQP